MTAFRVSVLTIIGSAALFAQSAGTLRVLSSNGIRVVFAQVFPVAQRNFGVGVRAGAPPPDMQTLEALKQVLLGAKSITYVRDGASRAHIERMIESLGIAAEMKPKTVLDSDSRSATVAVRQGNVDLVLTLASEIIPVDGVRFAGLLPAEFQQDVMFAGAVAAQSSNRDAAHGLLKYLSSQSIDAVLEVNGMKRP